MATCWVCSIKGNQTFVTSYKELLDTLVTYEKHKDLKNQLLKINGGGGDVKEKKVDVINNEFLQSQYPDAKSRIYCWPPLFEYDHPSESSDVVFSDDIDKKSEVQGVNSIKGEAPVRYATVHRKRKGEDPEEKLFTMIWSMLQRKKIPSFLIHGYKWNKWGYGRNKLKNIYKIDGELDLLILLPGMCLVSIEVKAASSTKDGGVQNVITKVFGQDKKSKVCSEVKAAGTKNKGDKEDDIGQCERTLMFVSKVCSDLFHGKNIPFIKVAALPNCSKREDFQEEPICDSCSKYLITKDDLVNVKKVCEWFDAVIRDFRSHQKSTDFDGDLHEKVIGRLLGLKYLMEENGVPASQLKKMKLGVERHGKKYATEVKAQAVKTYEQIIEQFGTVEKIHSRWIQFNPEQRDVIMDNAKLLWLTGEPGSGKTLLFWNKIEKLLNGFEENYTSGKKHAVVVIPGNENDLLYKKYLHQFSQIIFPESCDLCIEKFCDDSPFRPKTAVSKPTCNILPKVIKMYQDYRREEVLHIFIDESDWLLKGTNKSHFESDWEKLDFERLGFVWVIQNPLSTNDDEVREEIPNFEKVHLKHVMRMTKENVRFVSHMLGRKLLSGHGVAGIKPELYRMSCICSYPVASDSIHCGICIHKRQVLLIVQILKNFQVDAKEKSHFAILMTETHKKYVGKIMEKYTNKFYHDINCDEIIISYSSFFRGCEERIVVIDLSDPAIKVENLMESLTRCLSGLVLIDTGIDHPDNEKDYEYVKEKISTASDQGLILIKDVTEKDIGEEEMKFILNLK